MKYLLLALMLVLLCSCWSESGGEHDGQLDTDRRDPIMTLAVDDIYDRIQDHFEYLDQPVRYQPDRADRVMAYSSNDRDLYFIHDLVGITNNAGMGAWIHYHRNDDGWIEDAQRAFSSLGYRTIADSIKSCVDVYDKKGSQMQHEDDRLFSMEIWDDADKIIRDLYESLLSRGFEFKRPNSGA